jgi:hypothetical protein
MKHIQVTIKGNIIKVNWDVLVLYDWMAIVCVNLILAIRRILEPSIMAPSDLPTSDRRVRGKYKGGGSYIMPTYDIQLHRVQELCIIGITLIQLYLSKVALVYCGWDTYGSSALYDMGYYGVNTYYKIMVYYGSVKLGVSGKEINHNAWVPQVMHMRHKQQIWRITSQSVLHQVILAGQYVN